MARLIRTDLAIELLQDKSRREPLYTTNRTNPNTEYCWIDISRKLEVEQHRIDSQGQTTNPGDDEDPLLKRASNLENHWHGDFQGCFRWCRPNGRPCNGDEHSLISRKSYCMVRYQATHAGYHPQIYNLFKCTGFKVGVQEIRGMRRWIVCRSIQQRRFLGPRFHNSRYQKILWTKMVNDFTLDVLLGGRFAANMYQSYALRYPMGKGLFYAGRSFNLVLQAKKKMRMES